MKKRILLSLACMVVFAVCFSAFSVEYVIIRPEIMYPSWMRDEWEDGDVTSQHPCPHAVGRYNDPTKYYHGGMNCLCCMDQDFDGHMGVNLDRSSSMYPYSYHYGYIGTTDERYDVAHGEARTAVNYDFNAEFERIRNYDHNYFSPSASPTTDGWTAWRTAGGPSKHWQQNRPPGYVYTSYTQYPMHFDNVNTTNAGVVNLNNTIDRVMFGFPQQKVGGLDDVKTFEICHLQPPLDQIRCAPFDNVFGNHSNGSNYVDRTIVRLGTGPAVTQTYETQAYPQSRYITTANNYPTTRTATNGYIVIDEPGTANDQFTYTGAGDTDPLINSLISDMRGGRNMVWFNYRAYNYYVDAWDQTKDYGFLMYTSYDHGSNVMFIDFGDPASAEDWVLYK